MKSFHVLFLCCFKLRQILRLETAHCQSSKKSDVPFFFSSVFHLIYRQLMIWMSSFSRLLLYWCFPRFFFLLLVWKHSTSPPLHTPTLWYSTLKQGCISRGVMNSCFHFFYLPFSIYLAVLIIQEIFLGEIIFLWCSMTLTLYVFAHMLFSRSFAFMHVQC